jgi:hypothetical protein
VAVTHAEAIREHYTSALDGLWSSLAGTVTVLEQLAADPEELDDETTLVLLPGLQYSLHRAGELVHGIAPPPGTREAHRELEAALEDARDVTGDVAALLEADDSETAAQLVLEWRGALFRVRLARRRLVRTSPLVLRTEIERRGTTAAALGSLTLLVLGLGAFLAGAVLVTWPLWAAGLALVAGALLAYRPS